MNDQFTLLCRAVGEREWLEAANPLWSEPNSEYYAALMLANRFNEHVEWCNCGIVYRLVRTEEFDKPDAIALKERA